MNFRRMSFRNETDCERKNNNLLFIIHLSLMKPYILLEMISDIIVINKGVLYFFINDAYNLVSNTSSFATVIEIKQS